MADIAKEFVDIRKIEKSEGVDELFTVIGQIGDYTLIYRYTKFEPWVVAWCFKGTYWEQGHYFDTFEDAVQYMIANSITKYPTEDYKKTW